MKKLAAVLFSLGVVVSGSLPAMAVPEGLFRDTDGTIFMNGVPAQSEMVFTYPGTPKVTSARANGCGAVTVKGSNGIPVSGTIKVDNVAVDTSTLPTRLLPNCVNGAFQEARTTNFKTPDGSVVVVGKTANSFYGVETSENATRRVRANACGIIVLKPNNRYTHAPTSSITYNTGTPITKLVSEITQKGTPLCRNGEAYYPPNWL